MVKSIAKGKRFEREIAKWLSKLTNVKWQRVPQSGATATTQNLNNPIFRGDIFTENEKYKDFVVECKITKEIISLSDLMANPKSIFWRWIKQLKRESGDNPPILIFRDGTHKTYIATIDEGLYSDYFTSEIKPKIEPMIYPPHIFLYPIFIDDSSEKHVLHIWLLKKPTWRRRIGDE